VLLQNISKSTESLDQNTRSQKAETSHERIAYAPCGDFSAFCPKCWKLADIWVLIKTRGLVFFFLYIACSDSHKTKYPGGHDIYQKCWLWLVTFF